VASSANPDKKLSGRQPPGRTPEERENQLIAKAYDLVERRLDEGTATSQETVHFLKMGSPNARLERKNLEMTNELILAKTEALKSAKRSEELFKEAMSAFSTYSGQKRVEDDA
jgi:uncharacterized protein (DUF1015 family)